MRTDPPSNNCTTQFILTQTFGTPASVGYELDYELVNCWQKYGCRHLNGTCVLDPNNYITGSWELWWDVKGGDVCPGP